MLLQFDFRFFSFVFIQGEATIHYNKLQADPKQGKSLDIGISFISPRLNLRLRFIYCFQSV